MIDKLTATDPNRTSFWIFEMRRIVMLFWLFWVAACEPNNLYTTSDGEAYLNGTVQSGSTMQEIEQALAERNIEFSEIPANECGDAGDTWMDPRCVCAGGPALWLTLSENARPYNPLYNPTMNAFLAFNEKKALIYTVVMLLDED